MLLNEIVFAIYIV